MKEKRFQGKPAAEEVNRGGHGRTGDLRIQGRVCHVGTAGGKRQVIFAAVGDDVCTIWQKEYFKLQRNAVRWLLRAL